MTVRTLSLSICTYKYQSIGEYTSLQNYHSQIIQHWEFGYDYNIRNYEISILMKYVIKFYRLYISQYFWVNIKL